MLQLKENDFQENKKEYEVKCIHSKVFKINLIFITNFKL